MDLENFGKFIATLRNERGLTQRALGDQLKVSDKTVSKWERGMSAPDISLIVALSEILGVTTTELLNGKKIENYISKEEANNIALSSIRFYSKIFKKKYFKIFFSCLLFIFLFLFMIFSIFTLNNFNKCSVYLIKSNDANFEIEGIIALNQQKRRIIITKVNYLDPSIGTNQEKYTENIEVSLKSDDKNILIKGIPMNKQSLSDALEKISINIEEHIENNEYKINKRDFRNMTLIIKFLDTNDQSNELIIPLLVNKEFSNDKLVY